MVTTKQIVANRKNGKKGGVKTAAGKVVSRYNARKHGVLSKELLLPTEDANELSKFKAGMVDALKPQDEMQAMFVDTIVCCVWRKHRTIRHEGKAIDFGNYFRTPGPDRFCELIMRYEAALDRQMYRALSTLKELQGINKVEGGSNN